ncbi:TRAP transporter small permease [Marinobacterium arenosum]|uniref:TRAP transporter small permease n=1 Tax=Marinobacterium arenosum TaxID=2862496 RepID=UPI001C98AC9D|nr:TRAP transporter small permease [Marinobacterium arenosum]MBY4675127.1 TRAP transporter small permease [Marinobacterium arenosum]
MADHPLLRVTVLWLALLGAMAATRQQSHIAIDLLSRQLPLAWCLAAERVIHAFAAGICVLLSWYSLQLVLMEYQDGLIAFARVPVWLCQSIMPLAFAVMAWRFLRQSLYGSQKLDHLAQTGGPQP